MALKSFVSNTKIVSADVNSNFTNLANHGLNFTMKWTFADGLYLVQSPDMIALPDNATITRIDLIAGTGPVGASIIVDILKSQDNGATFTTILTNTADRPQIADGSRAGNTTTIDIASIVKLTDFFVPKIVQIGSSTPGSDLSVMIRGEYNLD